ncbi:helix-turn-helix domain-containing protein [Candidatus Parcubacteria bacterium]|nr:helix-turn-helix domain-containing protein [Candidatus Parcubacteria bacterium]
MAIKKLSDAIRRKLKEKGLNQETLATRLRIPSPTFRSWMRENNFPSDHLLKITQALGIGDDLQALKEYSFSIANPRRKLRTSTLEVKDRMPEDLLPLIKAIADSRAKGIKFEQFLQLIKVQAQLHGPITAALVNEMLPLL